jgi:hypothetical protein
MPRQLVVVGVAGKPRECFLCVLRPAKSAWLNWGRRDAKVTDFCNTPGTMAAEFAVQKRGWR